MRCAREFEVKVKTEERSVWRESEKKNDTLVVAAKTREELAYWWRLKW